MSLHPHDFKIPPEGQCWKHNSQKVNGQFRSFREDCFNGGNIADVVTAVISSNAVSRKRRRRVGKPLCHEVLHEQQSGAIFTGSRRQITRTAAWRTSTRSCEGSRAGMMLFARVFGGLKNFVTWGAEIRTDSKGFSVSATHPQRLTRYLTDGKYDDSIGGIPAR